MRKVECGVAGGSRASAGDAGAAACSLECMIGMADAAAGTGNCASLETGSGSGSAPSSVPGSMEGAGAGLASGAGASMPLSGSGFSGTRTGPAAAEPVRGVFGEFHDTTSSTSAP
ncbi:hypothetical protein D9M68_798020 [compost metagenome]